VATSAAFWKAACGIPLKHPLGAAFEVLGQREVLSRGPWSGGAAGAGAGGEVGAEEANGELRRAHERAWDPLPTLLLLLVLLLGLVVVQLRPGAAVVGCVGGGESLGVALRLWGSPLPAEGRPAAVPEPR